MTRRGFLLKRLLHLLLRLFYRYEVHGLEHMRGLPPGERVLIVVNHVSFLDGALMMASLGELPVFAINAEMANRWWLRPFHGIASLFPLDPRNAMAVKALIERVRTGRPCVIFPEGRISVTGALMKIYAGPAYIADRTDATILPVRIAGAELTPFSRLGDGQVRRRWFPKITITVCPPRRLHLDDALRGKQRRRTASLQLYDIMSEMVFRTTDWGATLFEALLRARARHGGSVPVLQDMSGQTVSYRRLVMGAMALGRQLAAETRPGERVGVLLPNANAAAVLFMALQAFGRVPAMLNFSAGVANLEAALTAAEVRLVVSSSTFIERAKLEPVAAALGERVRMIWLEEVRSRIGRRERLRALADSLNARRLHRRFGLGRDDPAVVLFTSGSEGKPKGVLLSQGNILANCAQISARIDFNEHDRCFNVLPVFHSFGLTGALLLPMLGGVPVFMYPSPLHYRIVPEMVYDSNATILFGTNSFLKGYARVADPYDFRSLRYVFAGAEPVQEETKALWNDKFGIRLLTGYGATEAAPVLSLNTAMHSRPGTVGRLLPDIAWRLEPVDGIDHGGRLWVKGPNVMLGYLRAERPGVVEPPPDGWYDTGDIVDVDAEGYVTILGRVKRFAKVGGEMVSLGAVEEVIQALRPETAHAVIALPDPRKGERIVLVTTDPDLERGDLVRALRTAGLPELMLPAEIVRTTALPLLGTGKTDYPAVQRLVVERLGRVA